jgi:hypothetical protein
VKATLTIIKDNRLNITIYVRAEPELASILRAESRDC